MGALYVKVVRTQTDDVLKVTHYEVARKPSLSERMGRVELPDAPLPLLAIGCAGPSIPTLVALRERGVPTVYVQDPRRGYDRFDLVVAPAHDGVTAPNAVSMIGSPNRIHAPTFSQSKASDVLNTLPRPRVAFLIGGNSSRHSFDQSTIETVTGAVRDVLASGASAMVALSRRTPDTLAEALRSVSHSRLVFDDPVTFDPSYHDILGYADAALVTEDSVNMLCEAASISLPVYRLPVSGHAGKLQHLYDQLESERGIRLWDHNIDFDAQFMPLMETDRVAREIVERLGLPAPLATHTTPR